MNTAPSAGIKKKKKRVCVKTEMQSKQSLKNTKHYNPYTPYGKTSNMEVRGEALKKTHEQR